MTVICLYFYKATFCSQQLNFQNCYGLISPCGRQNGSRTAPIAGNGRLFRSLGTHLRNIEFNISLQSLILGPHYSIFNGMISQEDSSANSSLKVEMLPLLTGSRKHYLILSASFKSWPVNMDDVSKRQAKEKDLKSKMQIIISNVKSCVQIFIITRSELGFNTSSSEH